MTRSGSEPTAAAECPRHPARRKTANEPQTASAARYALGGGELRRRPDRSEHARPPREGAVAKDTIGSGTRSDDNYAWRPEPRRCAFLPGSGLLYGRPGH